MIKPLHITSDTIATNTISSDQLKDKLIIELEKKIDSITSGAEPHYNSIFKKMLYGNYENTNLFFSMLEEDINQYNRKLNTTLIQIEVMYYFSKFTNFKDFYKITKKKTL